MLTACEFLSLIKANSTFVLRQRGEWEIHIGTICDRIWDRVCWQGHDSNTKVCYTFITLTSPSHLWLNRLCRDALQFRAAFDVDLTPIAINLTTINYYSAPFTFSKGTSTYENYVLQLNGSPCPCYTFGFISGADLGKGRLSNSSFHVVRDIRLQIPPFFLQRLSSVLYYILKESKTPAEVNWSLPFHEGSLSFGTNINKKPSTYVMFCHSS